MNLEDLRYLNFVLGEEETKKYLITNNSRLVYLVPILKYTDIRKILSPEELRDFCNKLIFGKYGTTFMELINSFNYFIVPNKLEILKLMVDLFKKTGYKNIKDYRKVFELFMMNLELENEDKFLIKKITNLLELELAKTKSYPVKTVGDFLAGGGSLKELILILSKSDNITTIDLDTEIDLSKLVANSSFDYQVDITVINYLTAVRSTLDMSSDAEMELLATHYEGLNYLKNNCLSNEITITNRPNLYNYLKEHNLLLETNKQAKKRIYKFKY